MEQEEAVLAREKSSMMRTERLIIRGSPGPRLRMIAERGQEARLL